MRSPATRLPPLSSDPERWSVGSGLVVEIGDRRVLLLPFAAPTGPSRGRRYEVVWGNDRRTHAVVLSIEGRAAVAPPSGVEWRVGTAVAVRLRPVRERPSLRVPTDVGLRLEAEGLSAAAVPATHWAQMLAMVRESSTSEVRAARIDALASAVRTWSGGPSASGTP